MKLQEQGKTEQAKKDLGNFYRFLIVLSIKDTDVVADMGMILPQVSVIKYHNTGDFCYLFPFPLYMTHDRYIIWTMFLEIYTGQTCILLRSFH